MEENSLIIQPLPGIGDLIWHLPHIHAIAKQEGSISLLTKPRSAAKDILKHDPHIKRILWIERDPGRHDGVRGFFRLSHELKQFGFKKVWIMHHSSRYAWVSRLAKIKDICALKKSDGHPIDEANHLLKTQGIFVDPGPIVYVDEQLMALIRQRVSPRSAPWIGIGIGTSEPDRQWGANRFAELILALYKQISSATFFLFGGKQEETLAQQINALSHDSNVVLMIGQPLQEVMALLKQCQLLVSNDTGILNLSAALQTPVIGLFGVTYLDYSKYIHPVTPKKASGMAGISVDQVVEKVLEGLYTAQPCCPKIQYI